MGRRTIQRPSNRRQSAKVADHLAGLTVTQGRLAGQPFLALPWERRFVLGAFRDGVAGAALSVERGNSKSGLMAGD